MTHKAFKSVKPFATIILVSFVLLSIMLISRAGVYIMGLDFVQRVSQQQNATVDDGKKIDEIEMVVVRLYQVIQLFSAVMFVLWMRRIRLNFSSINVEGAKWSPAQCIYSWMIPIAFVAWPYLIMQELWRASDPKETDDTVWQQTSRSKLILAWWLLWILFGVIGSAASFQARLITIGRGNNLETLRSFYLVSFADQLIGLVTVGLAIAVVLTLTERHESKYRVVQRQVEDEDD